MKNVKNGYYINGEIYVNSYDEFMETIENESLSNDEFSYLTIYPNKNGKLTFLGNNEGEVGGEIDTADEMVVISKNNEDVSILDMTKPEKSFNKSFVDDITFLFDDIDFSENVFVKDCDEFLNYINNIKPDIIDMYDGNTYNNLVNAAVEME